MGTAFLDEGDGGLDEALTGVLPGSHAKDDSRCGDLL
jgi:hypothetical protein